MASATGVVCDTAIEAVADANPGIHSIEVIFERTGKFVRLKPSNHAYQKLARQAARSNRMNGLAFANCSAHSASITHARTISR
jgi:hypothetical protein